MKLPQPHPPPTSSNGQKFVNTKRRKRLRRLFSKWDVSKLQYYSHGQELFYKFVSNFTNKLVKQLLSMTVLLYAIRDHFPNNGKH